MSKHWSEDVENILKKLRLNSLLRSKYHKISYFNMSKMLKYFRIPVIFLSGVSSVFSIALQMYIPVQTASLICCFISLIVGIIGSIEMFLQIQKRMEIDLHNSKSFSTLATDITKILNLSKENRTIDGITYLDEKMNEYNSLVDLSIVVDLQLHEKILELNLINNLTEEEELTVLSNDNVQALFRKYRFSFLELEKERNEIEKKSSELERTSTHSSMLSTIISAVRPNSRRTTPRNSGYRPGRSLSYQRNAQFANDVIRKLDSINETNEKESEDNTIFLGNKTETSQENIVLEYPVDDSNI